MKKNHRGHDLSAQELYLKNHRKHHFQEGKQ